MQELSEKPATATQENTILRINADRVSNLMDIVGELGLAAGAMIHHKEIQGLDLESFWVAAHRLNLIIQEVQDASASLSLVPVKTVFSRMRRLIRELSDQTGKKIDLKLVGEEVEIDKGVVDSLYDPLVHIVRNSADHGLETPEERVAAGKDEKGTITLSAIQQGSDIHIIIEDNGRGLNKERILNRARDRGICGPKENPPDSVIWNYIFQAGFSTAETVSNLSGRGVGMDVVQNTIQKLRGHISVESFEGEGTKITLKIPMTLAFLDCFVVRYDNRLLVLPIESVAEVFKPTDDQITIASVNESEMATVRDELLPIFRLEKYYDRNHNVKPLTDQVFMVLYSSRGKFCMPVDEIIGQQQVTMKPLQGRLKKIRAGSGCAILNSGEIAVALDTERLFHEELNGVNHE